MATAAKPKILIIEDELLPAMVLQIYLEEMGYSVCGLISDPDEILPTATREHPALVLIDANLHGKLVGVAMATLLKERLNIPSILISGYPEKDILGTSPAPGVVAFHPKPYLKELLKSQVAQALHELKT